MNFKGGFSIGKPGAAGASKKPAPLSSAFSMDDAAEGETDATTNEANNTEDPKGLLNCWKTTVCAGWLTVSRLV